MKRKMICIDEEKCDGCGQCLPNCPEGALQIIDGKVRLISDLFCDGLGACVGYCPTGALTVEDRESEPYDEKRVMENIMKGGAHVIQAHLDHLNAHHETQFLQIAIDILHEKGLPIPVLTESIAAQSSQTACQCAGSAEKDFTKSMINTINNQSEETPSQLRQWPVQLHLISPRATYFQGKDVVLAADCVAYALGNFHSTYLVGHTLAIACPKLDHGTEQYIDKLTEMIDQSKINSLTIMIMEVPCCMGLLKIATAARAKATRQIPIQKVVVSIQGDILEKSVC